MAHDQTQVMRDVIEHMTASDARRALQNIVSALYRDGDDTEWSADTAPEVAAALDDAVEGAIRRPSLAARVTQAYRRASRRARRVLSVWGHLGGE